MTSINPSPFIALHAIHTVPASLLNRDVNGAAKQITVDGTPRIRVSSQAWKRAMRMHHRAAFLTDGGAALRTRRLPHLIADHLITSHGIDTDRAALVAYHAIKALELAMEEKTGNTKSMTFTAYDAPEQIAAILAPVANTIDLDTIASDKQLTGAIRAAFETGDCIDLSVYGRMLANSDTNWEGRIDGALQLAHPFSTHPGSIEMDFFSAVDDMPGDGETASGFLESADLTAPTLYRYAAIDRHQLTANLAAAQHPDQLTQRAIAATVTDFICALPQAKIRATAATTLPSVVFAVTGRAAYSAANAFSPAVQGRTITEESIRRLLDQLQRNTTITGGDIVALPLDAAADAALAHSDLAQVATITELIEALQ